MSIQVITVVIDIFIKIIAKFVSLLCEYQIRENVLLTFGVMQETIEEV